MLYSDDDDLSDLYKHFVSANHDAAEACVKQVKINIKKGSCYDPRLHVARQKVFEANHAYNRDIDSQLLRDKYKLEN